MNYVRRALNGVFDTIDVLHRFMRGAVKFTLVVVLETIALCFAVFIWLLLLAAFIKLFI